VGGFLLRNVRLFLPQLFIQDGNLISRGPGLGLRLLNFGLRLLYACPQLLVVEHGDDVSSGYKVSLAHSDFENTAARLGDTAESSPSIRPLSGRMFGDIGGV